MGVPTFARIDALRFSPCDLCAHPGPVGSAHVVGLIATRHSIRILSVLAVASPPSLIPAHAVQHAPLALLVARSRWHFGDIVLAFSWCRRYPVNHAARLGIHPRMCAFIPKCHSFPFFVWCISG